MDVKDASGRVVSLLNHDSHARLPPIRPSEQSRTSSYSTQISRGNSYSSHASFRTSPVYSPRVPALGMDHSSSSHGSVESPSPLTPTYPFEPLEHPRTIDPYSKCYPTATYPTAHPRESESPYYRLSRSGESPIENGYDGERRPASQTRKRPSSSDAASPIDSPPTSKSPPKKNKYPCPHAQRFGCTDTFTTSGHAARHGKKHTGEKNILCPDCGKAFTRKDNMKQHQRTHQGRRESKTSKERDEPRRPKTKSEQASRARRQSTQSIREAEMLSEDCVAEGVAEAAAKASLLRHSQIASGLRIDTGGAGDGAGVRLASPADRLDALATAASGMSFSPGGASRYRSDDCKVY